MRIYLPDPKKGEGANLLLAWFIFLGVVSGVVWLVSNQPVLLAVAVTAIVAGLVWATRKPKPLPILNGDWARGPGITELTRRIRAESARTGFPAEGLWLPDTPAKTTTGYLVDASGRRFRTLHLLLVADDDARWVLGGKVHSKTFDALAEQAPQLTEA